MTKAEISFATDYLSTRYAEAKPELNYTSPFELLVAVVLSAQCTDKRVNLITPRLFAALPTAAAMAAADTEQIRELISSVSYPNSKTRYLSQLSRTLVCEHNGEVPHDLDALQRLPGVGRKTANVIFAVLWGEDVMPVDTHVFRVSQRIGFASDCSTPLAVEKRLASLLPKGSLAAAHHWLLLHGRYVCLARKPKCYDCGLLSVCLYYKENVATEK